MSRFEDKKTLTYVTTEHIQGQRFSEGFKEDLEWYEKNRQPMYVQHDTEGYSIRLTDPKGRLLPISRRDDWTHGNGSNNVLSDRPVTLEQFPNNLFTID
jgi:hypothetical protein